MSGESSSGIGLSGISKTSDPFSELSSSSSPPLSSSPSSGYGFTDDEKLRYTSFDSISNTDSSIYDIETETSGMSSSIPSYMSSESMNRAEIENDLLDTQSDSDSVSTALEYSEI